MTKQVGYRPIKCQSRSWPSKVTAVSGSHKGQSPLFEPTWIQYAATSMLGTTTNGQHRKLIGIKTMSLLVYGIQLSLSGVLPVFQNILCTTQPTKARQKYVCRYTCVACGNLSDFPLQYCTLIALVFGRGAVAKPSGGFPLQYRPLIA